MTVAMKGWIFHSHYDGWRIVPIAVILDPLEEDPRKTNSNNAAFTILDNSSKRNRWCQLVKCKNTVAVLHTLLNKGHVQIISCFHRI